MDFGQNDLLDLDLEADDGPAEAPPAPPATGEAKSSAAVINVKPATVPRAPHFRRPCQNSARNS